MRRNLTTAEFIAKSNLVHNYVDGYDQQTNTIYEFLGDYWHGNPEKYNPNKIHPRRKMTYKELYDETFRRFDKLVGMGYKVNYIWENDWRKFCDGKENIPKILCHL